MDIKLDYKECKFSNKFIDKKIILSSQKEYIIADISYNFVTSL